MALKSILVPLRGRDHEAEAIRSALRLGRAEDAYVRFLAARPSIETLAAGAERAGVACSEAILREAETSARRAEHRIRWAVQAAVVELGAPVFGPAERGGPGFGCAVATADAVIAEATATEAPYHDLVIYEMDRGPMRDVLLTAHSVDDPVMDAVLRQAGRPLLLGCRTLRDRLPRAAALACDDGAAAVRAVSAALPLLRQSETVQVIRVRTEADRDQERDLLLDYLHRHRIEASAEHIDPRGKSVAGALVSAVIERGLDLMVMGAGAGSRGSAKASSITRYVLRYATFPVLLAA